MKKIVLSFMTFIFLLCVVPELSYAARNPEKVVVTATTLNVRSYPSLKSNVIGSLKKDSIIYIHAVKPGGWAEIRYKNKPAYVSEFYLKRLTGIKNSRVTFTLKDSDDYLYKAYVVATREQKGYGSYNAELGFNSVWAGVSEGDLLFHGDYQIYLQKVGSSKVMNTGVRLSDYTYNVSRSMMYMIPSNYHKQPDIFAVASTEGSNFESANLFYVNKGKLFKINNSNRDINDWATIIYTTRPIPKGKFTLQTASYDNSDYGGWTVSNWSFQPNNATLRLIR